MPGQTPWFYLKSGTGLWLRHDFRWQSCKSVYDTPVPHSYTTSKYDKPIDDKPVDAGGEDDEEEGCWTPPDAHLNQFHMSVLAGTPLDTQPPPIPLLGHCMEPRSYINCTYAGVDADGFLTLGRPEAALNIAWTTWDCSQPPSLAGNILILVLAMFVCFAVLPIALVMSHVRHKPAPSSSWPRLPRSSVAWSALVCGWLLFLGGLVLMVLFEGAGSSADPAVFSMAGLMSMQLALRDDDPRSLIQLVYFGCLLVQLAFIVASVAALQGFIHSPSGYPVLRQPEDNGLSTLPFRTAFRAYAVESVDFLSFIAQLVLYAAASTIILISFRSKSTVSVHLSRMWFIQRTVCFLHFAVLLVACLSMLFVAVAVGGPVYPGDRIYADGMLRQNILFLVTLFLLAVLPTKTRRLRLHLWEVAVNPNFQLLSATHSETQSKSTPTLSSDEGLSDERSSDERPARGSISHMRSEEERVHRRIIRAIACDWDGIDLSRWRNATGRFDSLLLHRLRGRGGFATVWEAALERESLAPSYLPACPSCATFEAATAPTTASPTEPAPLGSLGHGHADGLPPDATASTAGSTSTDRLLVAVKVFQHAAYIRMKNVHLLEQELSMVQELSHPHVVRFLGTTLLGGQVPALVMELMAGSLADLIFHPEHLAPSCAARVGERLTAHDQRRLLHEVGLGLCYLHSRGILHRDVKAVNVLLDNELRAKIADFGLARRYQPSNCNETEMGTIRYLAPEMLFQPFDETGDIYSFSLLMWEVLHGAVAFAKDTYMVVLVKVRDGHRPHVQLAAHLRAYEPLLKACWQEQPALRPTMPEVVCELGRLLEDGRALDLAVESGSDEPHASTQPMVELTAEPLAASRERGDEGRIRVPAVAVAITAAGSGRGTDAFA